MWHKQHKRRNTMNLLDDNEASIYETLSTILILIICFSVKGESGCRELDFLDCEKNKTFTGHVIKSVPVLAPGLEQCQHKCYLNDQCVSYNLGPVEGMRRACELNDADHWKRPDHVEAKEGFEYCPIKSPCSSNPCPPDKLCTPDFSWDTFTCDDGHWTQWTSWSACHLPVCPRNRTRNCTNLDPQNVGAVCSGPGIETKECRIPTVNTTACEGPLGMEDEGILDSQITASSSHNGGAQSLGPYEARLNNQQTSTVMGAWSVGKAAVGEYLQVDLGKVTIVTKIATQGRPATLDEWVTEYSVSYSNDTTNWTNYHGDCIKKFPGNSDKNTIVTNKLEIPITTRHIRIIVQNWNSHPAMRMELYGCTSP